MSGIYIPVEMPKSCYDCPFAMQDYTTLFGNNLSRTRNSYACVLTHKAITSTKRNRFCPLVPVPEHGALIDRDDFFATCPELVDGYKRITDDLVVIPASGGNELFREIPEDDFGHGDGRSET